METDTFPLEELRLLLEKARVADANLKQCCQYQWRPPVSLDKVEAFEREIGIVLPEDYRSFLLQAGDGGAGPFGELFSLKQVHDWLDWQVEPERTPQLSPQIREWSCDDPDNWKRGCIPIASQGDTYFVCLMVAGPDRGRVLYMEYEGAWIFFPKEPDFLAWYCRWLREVINGYNIFWFATNLDGNEAELRQYYAQASTEDEQNLAIASMEKFPVLSEETKEFLTHVIHERLTISNAKNLLELAYRVAPEFYHQFLDKRWEAGLYDAVLVELNYSLYHVPIEQTSLAKRWRGRILNKLSELSQGAYVRALTLLVQCGDVKLEQAAFLLVRAEGDVKREVLMQFRRFPDARENIHLWFPALKQREDLELLRSALVSVPHTENTQLREILMEIQADFSSSVELPVHADPKNAEEWNRYTDCRKRYDIYHAACSAWQDAFHEAINPAVEGIPRPYRLEMDYWNIKDLGMDQTPPPHGIPIHPLIALAILEEHGRLPSTAYDWKRTLERIKRLKLHLHRNTVRTWDDETRCAVLCWPDSHSPPPPYYYNLHNWSAIGRMSNLRNLAVKEMCVDDFSLLVQCKNVQTLSLYNTNFTDCRLLLEMPNLKTVDLRLCRLSHKEVLENLTLDCQL